MIPASGAFPAEIPARPRLRVAAHSVPPLAVKVYVIQIHLLGSAKPKPDREIDLRGSWLGLGSEVGEGPCDADDLVRGPRDRLPLYDRAHIPTHPSTLGNSLRRRVTAISASRSACRARSRAFAARSPAASPAPGSSDTRRRLPRPQRPIKIDPYRTTATTAARPKRQTNLVTEHEFRQAALARCDR
jgi:hypothetical protein